MSDIHSNAKKPVAVAALTDDTQINQELSIEEQLAILKAEKEELEELYASTILNKKTPAPNAATTAVGLGLGSVIGTGISSAFGINRALTLGLGGVLGAVIGAIVSMDEE